MGIHIGAELTITTELFPMFSDGDLLFVPQQGELTITPELFPIFSVTGSAVRAPAGRVDYHN